MLCGIDIRHKTCWNHISDDDILTTRRISCPIPDDWPEGLITLRPHEIDLETIIMTRDADDQRSGEAKSYKRYCGHRVLTIQ